MLLFSDAGFFTYPLHAIALELMTYQAPCVDLLDNFPIQHPRAAATLGADTSLVNLFENPDAFICLY